MSTSFISDQNPYTVFKQDGSHQFYCRWTAKEDSLLSKAVAKYGTHKWTLVSSYIPGRTAVQCSTRWFGALNPNVHKGKWTKQEDKLLIDSVRFFQMLTKTSTSALPWNQVSESIPHRTGIQCQARWTEALDPAIRKGRWSLEEDRQLESAVAQYGCCWIRVASLIPTRTQRQSRTRWNQIHCKRLKAQQPFMHDSDNDVSVQSSEKAPEYLPNQDENKSKLANNSLFSSLPTSNPDLNYTLPNVPSINYNSMLLDDSMQNQGELNMNDIMESAISEPCAPLKSSPPTVVGKEFPATHIVSHQDQFMINNGPIPAYNDSNMFYSLLNNDPMEIPNPEDYQKYYNIQ